MTTPASSLDRRTLFASDAVRHLATASDAELRLLQVFSVVVSAGGLSAATAELRTDLSTISRQFKELESRVGAPLAKRGRSGFALTPAGQELHAITTRLFDALGAFRADVARIARPPGPLLRLGLVDALMSAPLTEALRACVAALPGLDVQVQTLRPIDIERRVLTGALDAGVVAARSPAAGLAQHVIYSEPNSLYVAKGHPWFRKPDAALSDAELQQAAWVCDPYSADLPHPELAGLAASRTQADSLEGVAVLVATGCFAGFLPDHLVAGRAAWGPLRRVQPTRFSHCQDIVLTCRQGKVDAPVRQLLRALTRTAG
ncbi:LysR family transcriptional regulator [Ideonella margarita]|uniref:LysR family transcriptional regulator n=1 Tax=Ideonella margarita TaxID=2984191 RepID=A0ABU9BZ53_9BURK